MMNPKMRAYHDGEDAYWEALCMDDNPFDLNSDEHEMWVEGWTDAQNDDIEDMEDYDDYDEDEWSDVDDEDDGLEYR